MAVMLLPLATALAMTAQSVPTNGALSQVAGGTIAGTTYYVKTTWVTSTGETAESAETSLAVSADYLLVAASPGSAPPNAIGWNIYVSSATGTETKQNGSTPIPVGTSWTLPTTGLVAGASAPSASIGQGTGEILLQVSPFAGGRNRNAFLNLPTLPTTGAVQILGTDLPAGGPPPALNDPSWAVIATINSSSPAKQEIQLPVWMQLNVSTVGTGTLTATLEGIQ
jgi:hypothetical protein